ncbi:MULTISPECIES: amidase family protein [Cyanophyceae]|uniref:amidase family protein n=1 Tax=Cyanophyceae TaxID=3028117 RepID=UPI0018EF622D|nr:amidase family protein [Trichocoleus sp. FACHB-40]
MLKSMKRTAALVAAQTIALGLLPLGALAGTFQLEEATVSSINRAFDAGALTSQELVQLYLNRIEVYDDKGPSLNSIITINPDALEVAAALDLERQTTGARSLLHGVPILLKDNYDTFDLPTSAGATVLQNSIPPDDAFVVDRLRDAGAIILGKTNLDEFARGSSGLSSVGGQTKNPYALDRVPGGSSGGTGASISANFATIGLGTETGVSIRNPAANNSLVGIASTEGLVSRGGVVPLSFTQDRTGPLARTVTDAAIVLDIIAGFDPSDPVTAKSIGQIPAGGYTSLLDKDALAGARVGVFRDLFRSGPIHEEGLAVIETAITDMKAQGATIVDDVTLGFDVFGFLANSRVNNLEFKFALNDYLESLGPDAPVKSLTEIIEDGRYLPRLEGGLIGSDAVESLENNPVYDELIARRSFLRNETLKVMDALDLDAIVYPMKTVPPGVIGQPDPESDNPFTSIAGLPGIVVPAGYTSAGLPIGIEFSGRPFSEAELLGLSYSYEQATQNRRTPSLFPSLAGETIEYESVPEPGVAIALGVFGLSALSLKRKKARSPA